MSHTKLQITDQLAKGSALGLISYFLNKAGVDPEFIAVSLPVIGSLLAWISTKIGDPSLASFFSKTTD